jgi:uncharacterized membrane protein
MSNLFVMAFDDEQGAERLLSAAADWQKQNLIKIDDAAILVRRADGKPKIKQARSLVGVGALGGAFWGALFGLLFLAPWLGAAIGAGIGALSGKLAGAGVDKKFIENVSNEIRPGNSALFIYTREGVVDKIMPQLKQYNPRIIQTSLSMEAEKQLKEALGAEEPEAAGIASK